MICFNSKSKTEGPIVLGLSVCLSVRLSVCMSDCLSGFLHPADQTGNLLHFCSNESSRSVINDTDKNQMSILLSSDLFTNWDKLCFFLLSFSWCFLRNIFTYINYHKIKLIYLISKVSWQFLRILIVFITTQSHIALVI